MLWALGSRTHNEKYLVLPLLQMVNLALKFDLVADRGPLGRLYELFLTFLRVKNYSETIASILVELTTKSDIDDRRAKLVRKSGDHLGHQYSLNSLRWKYRQLRPDLEPNCPPPTSGRPASNSAIHRRFQKVYDGGVGESVSGLGWEPGQLASKVVFKDRQKQCLLPSAETLNLEGGLASKKNKKIPLQCIESVAEAHERLESIELPNNLLSVLGCRVAANLLPRTELLDRFSLILYHTLQKEFFALPRVRSRAEIERRDKRQLRFLEIIRDFQTHCYQGIPVVGR